MTGREGLESAMPRDFTVRTYRRLLETALEAGYRAVSFRDYMTRDFGGVRTMILRHDVDRRPERSLAVARLQASLGARGTYYFRVVRQSFDEGIIRKIAALGHEIGYHYEDLALHHGNVERAIVHFRESLAMLRAICPVDTICMHGSPLSRWDNRQLWDTYDYRTLGILGEPYFDLDFERVLYLTDTGRRWNGASVAVRDKVEASHMPVFRSTFEIMDAFRRGTLPLHVVQCLHPERWTDDLPQWLWEWGSQNVKNIVKRFFFVGRGR